MLISKAQAVTSKIKYFRGSTGFNIRTNLFLAFSYDFPVLHLADDNTLSQLAKSFTLLIMFI